MYSKVLVFSIKFGQGYLLINDHIVYSDQDPSTTLGIAHNSFQLTLATKMACTYAAQVHIFI